MNLCVKTTLLMISQQERTPAKFQVPRVSLVTSGPEGPLVLTHCCSLAVAFVDDIEGNLCGEKKMLVYWGRKTSVTPTEINCCVFAGDVIRNDSLHSDSSGYADEEVSPPHR